MANPQNTTAPPRRHRTVIYRVEVDETTYRLFMALSAESRRPVADLIRMAARLLTTATRDISAMHPPSSSATPLTKEQRTAHIARSKTREKHPHSVGAVLRQLARQDRKD